MPRQLKCSRRRRVSNWAGESARLCLLRWRKKVGSGNCCDDSIGGGLNENTGRIGGCGLGRKGV